LQQQKRHSQGGCGCCKSTADCFPHTQILSSAHANLYSPSDSRALIASRRAARTHSRLFAGCSPLETILHAILYISSLVLGKISQQERAYKKADSGWWVIHILCKFSHTERAVFWLPFCCQRASLWARFAECICSLLVLEIVTRVH
jgi:hypothetical protein